MCMIKFMAYSAEILVRRAAVGYRLAPASVVYVQLHVVPNLRVDEGQHRFVAALAAYPQDPVRPERRRAVGANGVCYGVRHEHVAGVRGVRRVDVELGAARIDAPGQRAVHQRTAEVYRRRGGRRRHPPRAVTALRHLHGEVVCRPDLVHGLRHGESEALST